MPNQRKRPSPDEGRGKVYSENDSSANDTVKRSSFSPFSASTLIFLTSCALSAAWLFSPTTVSPSPASYAICSRKGSAVYTVDEDNSVVQCLVIQQSFIVDTGSLGRWLSGNYSGPALQVRYINDGSIIVPGMSDSHAHILEYGANRQLPLEGGKSIEGTVALVKQHILENPDTYKDTSKIIEGWGWDHTSWPVEEWPNSDAFESDPVLHGRPIVLQSKDGHALWLSKTAIAMSLPWPEAVDGGIIVRDTHGDPTGVLLDNAQPLAKRSTLTEQDLLRRFAATVKDVVALGLTSVHDAGLTPVSLQFFKRQAANGNMPIRIYGMTYFDDSGEYWGNTSKPVIVSGDDRLGARSVKMFADGALRSGGAALYEPYHDSAHTKGFMRLDAKLLHEMIPRFLHDGWQVNVHAIGDFANGIVLDAFEAALKNVDVAALRPRLEHAQILTQEDMVRVGKLGVIASVQPTHAISDMWYAEDRLGPQRVKGLYAFRSLLDNGARLTLGSDFPVEDMNPLAGFYAAITRLSPDGRSPHGSGGWFPEQRLTRQEALRGMTIDPAYASFTEDTLGSLVPGKRADYVVLSQDIMTVPADQILSTQVDATVIDGQPVFGKI
ncbi:amidohydrolase family-domain-containing protein [Hygrophoropsis aurantiaca]|uniref:Amidohydrolase family-domain-containing protein n=1 Tax=Hygrophoropsis aurantiaca TaxID=72124 RepID=A0ACB8AQK6_9AGAM|nr:amidohydrolase family-domain-containing protein [Hygrophoropsis aurantiaca]